MQRPRVSSEMARLTELFAGTWRGDETLHPSESNPRGGVAEGVWVVRASADGFCLLVDYDESQDGRSVYKGHGVHAYDAEGACFYAYWFDNVGGLSRAGNRARFEHDRYTYEMPSSRGTSRFTYAWKDGVFTFSIERKSDDATFVPMHEGTYRRDA